MPHQALSVSRQQRDFPVFPVSMGSGISEPVINQEVRMLVSGFRTGLAPGQGSLIRQPGLCWPLGGSTTHQEIREAFEGFATSSKRGRLPVFDSPSSVPVAQRYPFILRPNVTFGSPEVFKQGCG
jgi:hypothetical protein